VRIELTVPERVEAGHDFVMRAVLLNDSYEPVDVWRNAFVGPTATPRDGGPVPDSVEPTFGQPESPLRLQPFTFYGRDRQAGVLEPGVVVVTATYRPEGGEELSISREVVIG
jgi:hypothetical protein